MVLDEFTSRLDYASEISYMATLRTYSSATRRWEMSFLIAHQPQLITSFSGVFKDGEMQLEGSGRTLTGEPVLVRVRFFDITPSSFEWENRVSLDWGVTWYRDNTISASRAG
jgi:ABC-type cobalamin/Fe3+-siderophores transport system ATPase subunit